MRAKVATMRTYTEELITPDLAREYLTYNVHNRALRPRKITEYTEAIRDGRWRPNGEAIKFDVAGNLLDGQNRLHAVIAAERGVQMLVVRGLDSDDQETLDGGATRSLGDALKLRGEHSVTSLAAVIRSLHLWEEFSNSTVGQRLGRGQSRPVPLTRLLAYFEKNAEEFRDLTVQTDRIRKMTGVPTSVCAPLLRVMLALDADDTKDFWDRVEQGTASGMDLGQRDPLVALRQALRRLAGSRTNYNPTEMAALIIKAWNAYREGLPLANLRWRTGGSAPEAFPVMK